MKRLTEVSVDTHEQRIRAIQAIPRTMEYAFEGNPHYQLMLVETWYSFAMMAWTPWKWFYDQEEPTTRYQMPDD